MSESCLKLNFTNCVLFTVEAWQKGTWMQMPI